MKNKKLKCELCGKELNKSTYQLDDLTVCFTCYERAVEVGT